MDRNLILTPVLAMVALTALVWFWMYFTRLREIRVKRISPQALVDRTRATQALKRVAGPSDNLINLFEMPVLFYLAMVVLYVSSRVDEVFLVLAWVYVALRVGHSSIHCTYNRVLHRFSVYALSSLVLWVIWARVAWRLMTAG
jgi:hypothetical protein